MRVLRRADGTGYAVVPDAGGAFPEGDYRFHFEYQRTIPAQTLSERGQTGPESVAIDVPWEARNE